MHYTWLMTQFTSVFRRQRSAGAWEMKMLALWQKPQSYGIKRGQLRGGIQQQWENFKGKRSRALYFQS